MVVMLTKLKKVLLIKVILPAYLFTVTVVISMEAAKVTTTLTLLKTKMEQNRS